ncbi:MAG: 2-oxo acid dehydrogenase subunit E2, partial [Mesorhizobium sp.]
NVRIHYDHRVMDGANVARALERFEKILNGTVANEVVLLGQSVAAPARRRNAT